MLGFLKLSIELMLHGLMGSIFSKVKMDVPSEHRPVLMEIQGL
jgi:hypothetical protein